MWKEEYIKCHYHHHFLFYLNRADTHKIIMFSMKWHYTPSIQCIQNNIKLGKIIITGVKCKKHFIHVKLSGKVKSRLEAMIKIKGLTRWFLTLKYNMGHKIYQTIWIWNIWLIRVILHHKITIGNPKHLVSFWFVCISFVHTLPLCTWMYVCKCM